MMKTQILAHTPSIQHQFIDAEISCYYVFHSFNKINQQLNLQVETMQAPKILRSIDFRKSNKH